MMKNDDKTSFWDFKDLRGQSVSLTEREADIISCVFMGLRTKEISDLLNISDRTVDTQVLNLRKKLNLGSRNQMKEIVEKYDLNSKVKYHYDCLLNNTQKDESASQSFISSLLMFLKKKPSTMRWVGGLFVLAIAIFSFKDKMGVESANIRDSWNIPAIHHPYVERQSIQNYIWSKFKGDKKEKGGKDSNALWLRRCWKNNLG